MGYLIRNQKMEIQLRTLLSIFMFMSQYQSINGERCCEDGWTVSADHTKCYKVFDQNLNWFDADNFCHTQRAKLASIHNAFENTFIWQLVQSTNGNIGFVYLGATTTNPAAEDTKWWYWHDGSIFDFINFAPGQPDDWKGCSNDAHQQCLQMGIHTGPSSSKWDDGCCHAQEPFVCQKLAASTDCSPK